MRMSVVFFRTPLLSEPTSISAKSRQTNLTFPRPKTRRTVRGHGVCSSSATSCVFRTISAHIEAQLSYGPTDCTDVILTRRSRLSRAFKKTNSPIANFAAWAAPGSVPVFSPVIAKSNRSISDMVNLSDLLTTPNPRCCICLPLRNWSMNEGTVGELTTFWA